MASTQCVLCSEVLCTFIGFRRKAIQQLTQSLGFSIPFHPYIHGQDSEQAVSLLTIWLRHMGIWTDQLTKYHSYPTFMIKAQTLTCTFTQAAKMHVSVIHIGKRLDTIWHLLTFIWLTWVPKSLANSTS